MTPVPALRSPRQTLGGYVILPRLIDKVRLHARGELPADYFPQLLGGDGTLDRRFLAFAGLDAEALRAAILAAADDAAVLAWIERHAAPHTDADKRAWAETIDAYRPDPERAQRRALRYPQVAARFNVGLLSVFDLIDLDEERITSPDADAPSMDAIWASFAGPLQRFIRRRVENDADADDLIQTVFAKIHSGIGSLADAERLPAWIFQIARRTLIDHFRRRGSAPKFVGLPDELADTVESLAALGELADCVRPMIDRLPEPYRRALTLADLEGRTQRELADAMSLSLSGAKSRVQRGREQLKSLLLACCHLEFDRRGSVVDFEPRRECPGCSPSSCS